MPLRIKILVKDHFQRLLDHPPAINSPLILAAFIFALGVFGYLFHLQDCQIQQLDQMSQKVIQNQLSQKLTLANNHTNRNLLNPSQQIPEHIANLTRKPSPFKNTLNLEKLSESVCMIQGEYIFVDPQTNLPLRYHESFSSTKTDVEVKIKANNTDSFSLPVISNSHSYPASIKANGPILQVHYTGSGFLIDKRGYIVTNGHVTKPWETSDKYRHIIETGYQPKMVYFHAFFPEQKNAFDLDIIDSCNDNDVAILKCRPDSNLIPLQLADNTHLPAIGDTVILLGYPTGLDLLMARLPKNKIDPVRQNRPVSYTQQALDMARQNLIAPTATRGMCGQIARGKIIYDAETTHGASGCPVFDVNGNVIAINTAITAFSGTNFGIPIQSALDMLNKIAH